MRSWISSSTTCRRAKCSCSSVGPRCGSTPRRSAARVSTTSKAIAKSSRDARSSDWDRLRPRVRYELDERNLAVRLDVDPQLLERQVAAASQRSSGGHRVPPRHERLSQLRPQLDVHGRAARGTRGWPEPWPWTLQQLLHLEPHTRQPAGTDQRHLRSARADAAVDRRRRGGGHGHTGRVDADRGTHHLARLRSGSLFHPLPHRRPERLTDGAGDARHLRERSVDQERAAAAGHLHAERPADPRRRGSGTRCRAGCLRTPAGNRRFVLRDDVAPAAGPAAIPGTPSVSSASIPRRRTGSTTIQSCWRRTVSA